MSVVWMDGFNHYDSAHLGVRYSTNGSSRASISTSTKRTGAGGLLLTDNSGAGYADKTLPSSYSTLIAGVAALVGTPNSDSSTDTNRLFEFRESGTIHISLDWTTGRQLRVRRGNGAGTILATGSTVLVAGAWAYIECKVVIHDTAGSVEVRIGGATEILLTNIDTRNGGTGVVNDLLLGKPGLATGAYGLALDDLYVTDGAEGFLGDVKVETLMPNGAGNSAQFTPSAGSNWQNVDEVPYDGDTTYNHSATPGDKDTFALANSSSASGTVHAIQHNMRHRKDDAGSRTIRPVLRSGGADYVGTTVGVSDSYVETREIFTDNPDTSSPFTLAEINALEAGYELVT